MLNIFPEEVALKNKPTLKILIFKIKLLGYIQSVFLGVIMLQLLGPPKIDEIKMELQKFSCSLAW